MVTTASPCPRCGRERQPDDRFCARCGLPFESPEPVVGTPESPGPVREATAAPPAPTPTGSEQPAFRGTVLPSNVTPPAATLAGPSRSLEDVATWRYTQRPWLVGLLTFLTFGVYAIWWLGRTWWQIKQEDGDSGKAPFWHAMTQVVPIYNFFRFHAHMRTIVELTEPRSASPLSPGLMTLAWFLYNLVSGFASRQDVPYLFNAIAALLVAALIGWAQYGLNVAWRSRPGGAVAAGVHWLQWVVLFVFGLFWLLILVDGVANL